MPWYDSAKIMPPLLHSDTCTIMRCVRKIMEVGQQLSFNDDVAADGVWKAATNDNCKWQKGYIMAAATWTPYTAKLPN